ncbi:MAG: hypothetical protein KGJ59_11010 [Bacteroidota bacterium]|nr:hypothetical protein [Bacteroidota bacterium]
MTDEVSPKNPSEQKKGLEWGWVVAGTVVGVILMTFLFYIMSETFHTYYVPAFIGLLSFVIMGIIIGYKSEGYTVREPAIGGLLAMIIIIALFHYFFDYTPPLGQMISAPIAGFLLALLGGWVGEELQGTAERVKEMKINQKIGGLEWAWVIAGTVVGFILNNIFVFGLFVLLAYGVTGILVSLGVSFVITGYIVGYKSPGVTILEAALAGILGVVLNFFSLYFGFGADDIPVTYMIIGLIGGFVLSLFGGWVGEMVQKRVEAKAAGV